MRNFILLLLGACWIGIVCFILNGYGMNIFKSNTKTEISGDVKIKQEPEYRPKFKRLYTVTLNDRASMTITMRTGIFGNRDGSGELDQPGGRWVLFDPQKVADKILDPTLVPIIEQRVAEIYAIDKNFTNNKPSEFIDEGGVTWKRQ